MHFFDPHQWGSFGYAGRSQRKKNQKCPDGFSAWKRNQEKITAGVVHRWKLAGTIPGFLLFHPGLSIFYSSGIGKTTAFNRRSSLQFRPTKLPTNGLFPEQFLWCSGIAFVSSLLSLLIHRTFSINEKYTDPLCGLTSQRIF